MKTYERELEFSGVSGHAVIVEFEKPWRLVFWSKAQYVACWDLGGGVWFTPEWLETGSCEDLHCYEPIMDKQLKYSKVSILESGPARAKIHWHYALCNMRYEVFNGNTCADEYYTVYPDGIAIRKLVAWPGNGSDFGGNPGFWEVLEYILINSSGTTPEDVLRKNQCFTLQNEKGDRISFDWPLPRGISRYICARYPQIRDWNAYIGRIHLIDKPDPYVMFVRDPGLFPYRPCVYCKQDHPSFRVFEGEGNIFKHWPATDMENFVACVDGEDEVGKSAVHSSFVSCHYSGKPGDRPPRPCVWLFVTGATEGDDSFLAHFLQSWYHPAQVTTGYENKNNSGSSGPILYEGYAYSERSYQFRKIEGNSIRFLIQPKIAVINPVIRVIGWATPSVSIVIGGKRLDFEEFRYQVKHNNLWLWINKTIPVGKTEIEIMEESE